MFILFISLLINLSNVKSEDEKRILFNDPASVQSLLHQYEIQLNKYGFALRQVESKMMTLESENTKLKMDNKNMSDSIMKLQSRISLLEANNKSGITGGSFYDHSGSGVNALCLPHNPDNGVNVNSVSLHDGRAGSLYGSEYQFSYKNMKMNDDVPCAVCTVKHASSVLVMPAKTSCQQGWKEQYSGILMTSDDNYKASSEYICMDGDPEYIDGTRSHNDDGKLFDPVKTVCGSLPCPPYSNGAIDECSICTI